ncbi:MAG TPA: LCP family protein [Gaiellaceae bacterium]|jgi:LCP family protein required for cell wall assembly|nr:LCP family protein [Gaiellaceae bacterium]
MASKDKPYRVYRGGRVKGKVPAVPGKTSSPRTAPKKTTTRRQRSRFRLGGRSWKTLAVLAALGLVVLAIGWGIVGFLSFQSGASDANKRFAKEHGAKAQLAKSNGFLLSHGTTILLLGTDSSTASGRSGDRHADSILLVRTDPAHHKLSYLSIPRDLLVEVPGVGNTKINASYQAGGAALAIKTVHEFTGVAVDHAVIVDFNGFKDLIDAEGGITINVPEAIRSNRFDCPYPTEARCLQWKGWRFHRGTQHMTGEQALIYSRIRENQLDPGENDLTRGARQQAVAQAATAKLTSFSTFLDLPFDGTSLMKPLTTDLSPWQLLELGWVKFRSSSSHTLYCRLGGDPETVGGSSVLVPSEDNRNVLAMWAGLSAPQPPTGTFGPGCRTGHPLQ